jgi:hypothetical protein
MAGDAAGPVGVIGVLEDYDRLLLAADHARWVTWLRARPERPGSLLNLWRWPYPMVMLRFFVRTHVRRGVQTLHRRLGAEQALARPSAVPREEEAAALYLDAVPPAHGRGIALALVAGFLVVGRLAVQYAGEGLSRVPALTHVRPGGLFVSASSVDRSQEAQRLMHQLGEALTQGVPSPAKVLDVLLSARLSNLAVVASASSLALFAVLRPFVPAFRLKRALLNTCGDPVALASSTARWQVARRTGTYAREQRLFDRLGTRPPHELPFDLLVSGLFCVAPFGLGIYLLLRAGWWARWAGYVEYDQTLVIGCLLIFLALVRVGWLVRTWWRRQHDVDDVRAPYDVRLPTGQHAVVRDPLAVGLAVFVLPQVFFLWLWTAVRDWHRASRVTGVDGRRDGPAVVHLRLSRSQLWWCGGVVATCAGGWLLQQVPIPPVSFLLPSDALHQWPPGTWWPAFLYWFVLSVCSAPVAAYCQASLNGRLKRSGRPVSEAPTPSTGVVDEMRLQLRGVAQPGQLDRH